MGYGTQRTFINSLRKREQKGKKEKEKKKGEVQRQKVERVFFSYVFILLDYDIGIKLYNYIDK